MVDVGAVVVDPDFFGQWVFAGGLAVEEEDIGFDAIGIEDTGGKTQDGVEVGGLHEFLANGLAGTTFEEDIVGEDYGGQAGTSMASPIVSALAALVMAQNPSLTGAQVRTRLAATCDDQGKPGFDTVSGWGLINAARALK